MTGVNAEVTLASANDWLNTLLSRTVDLVLTGPPHSTDHWWEDGAHPVGWFYKLLTKVKPTGAMLIHVGPYARDIKAYLSLQPHPAQILFWDWRIAYGGIPGPGEPFVRCCDPILYYPGEEHRLREEDFAIDSLPWAEHLQRLVRMTTDEGDLVIDPFAGWGGCLLAAAAEERRAIGSDISEESLAVAVEKGCVRV